MKKSKSGIGRTEEMGFYRTACYGLLVFLTEYRTVNGEKLN